MSRKMKNPDHIGADGNDDGENSSSTVRMRSHSSTMHQARRKKNRSMYHSAAKDHPTRVSTGSFGVPMTLLPAPGVASSVGCWES